MILGIRGIEESSVYQSSFAKGQAEGLAEAKAENEARGRLDQARLLLLRLGRRKLGPPGEGIEARIAALSDVDRLRELLERIIDVTTWDELLGPADRS